MFSCYVSFPVRSTNHLRSFVSSTPQNMTNPINVAYSNVGLDLHCDLAYYESPPGLQLLHCLQFDDAIVGGETQLVDGYRAAEVR